MLGVQFSPLCLLNEKLLFFHNELFCVILVLQKMFNGGTVQVWTCMNFSTRLNHDVSGFCQRLVDMCNKKGMVW